MYICLTTNNMYFYNGANKKAVKCCEHVTELWSSQSIHTKVITLIMEDHENAFTY